MPEFGAHQRGALAAYWLMTEGPQHPPTLAARLYDSEEDGYNLLTNVSGALRMVNDHGWWYLDFMPVLGDVRLLLPKIVERIDETKEGMAFCRPLTRREMLRLRRVLEHIEKLVKIPDCP